MIERIKARAKIADEAWTQELGDSIVEELKGKIAKTMVDEMMDGKTYIIGNLNGIVDEDEKTCSRGVTIEMDYQRVTFCKECRHFLGGIICTIRYEKGQEAIWRGDVADAQSILAQAGIIDNYKFLTVKPEDFCSKGESLLTDIVKMEKKEAIPSI